MDFLTGTWRSVKDFRKGGRRRACVVDLVTAARVNITSMAAKFSSRRRKHKHPIEAAAGARLPPILLPSTYETIRNRPNRGSSQPRAPACVTHAPSHVLCLIFQKIIIKHKILSLYRIFILIKIFGILKNIWYLSISFIYHCLEKIINYFFFNFISHVLSQKYEWKIDKYCINLKILISK